MAGDFNITFEKEDKKYGNCIKTKSIVNLQNLLETHKLIDVWRNKHPTSRMFTWSRKRPPVLCRLDYFFINKANIDSCTKCSILVSIQTDHKLFYLHMGIVRKHSIGRGFYKFNNSLLDDDEYVNLVS